MEYCSQEQIQDSQIISKCIEVYEESVSQENLLNCSQVLGHVAGQKNSIY